MIQVRQNGDEWEVVSGDVVLASLGSYQLAIDHIAGMMRAGQIDVYTGRLAAVIVDGVDGTDDDGDATDGLLPERWTSTSGIAFSQETGDGRDFTNCAWSWRDPGAGIVPLMLQTCMDWGHMGAELAGFVEEFTSTGGTTYAAGRFYDSDAGEQFRDMLLGGRSFGVSVDPGAVTYEEHCLEVDDDGWCNQWTLEFLTYEIIGVTGTPFPGFASASITLEAASVAASAGCDDCERVTHQLSTRRLPEAFVAAATRRRADAAQRLVAGASTTMGTLVASQTATDVAQRPPAQARNGAALVQVPSTPPRSWFDNPNLPCASPVTITREGRVLSHIAAWGTCHTGYENECVLPPRGGDYADFMSGGVMCEGDQRAPSGALTWGIPHADLSLQLIAAMSHYADSTHGWADVATGEDAHGIWVSGALRPGLTEDDLRVLRALSLSGDWRYSQRTGNLSMIAALAVNYPGFPIPQSITAAATAAHPGFDLDQVWRPAVRMEGDRPMALVASGMIRPGDGTDDNRSRQIEQRLAALESRLAAPVRESMRDVRKDLARSTLRG